MEPIRLMNFLNKLEKLKCNTRHSYTSSGRRESVAEHSFRLSVMAYLMKDEFPEIDINKVILMGLVHDWGEAVTGDIPSFFKTDQHRMEEDKEVQNLLKELPAPYHEELMLLFQEMAELKTPEAKLYKALDRLEAVIQHNEAEISTWLPLEYELNQIYGEEEAKAFPYVQQLRELAKDITKDKIRNEGFVKNTNK